MIIYKKVFGDALMYTNTGTIYINYRLDDIKAAAIYYNNDISIIIIIIIIIFMLVSIN